MKTATVNICIGSQPYLYNYIVWCSGRNVFLKENILFGELVEFLSSLLLSPYYPDALSPVEFASHLLKIAEEEEYSFTVPYSLIEDFDCFK